MNELKKRMYFTGFLFFLLKNFDRECQDITGTNQVSD